jgi:hypothetical protein
MAENQQPTAQIATPDAALKSLDVLVGTWQLGGDTQGQVRYEWLAGGFFLVQHIDLLHAGNHTLGMEVIGRILAFGATEPSADIKSRFYGSGGETFDYVYELEGDTLTIWGGEKGSPAYYRGTFNADRTTLAGEWVYPGGGYSSTMTRIK